MWSDMTPRERDDLIARHLFGYATLLAEDSVFGPTLWLHDVEAVCDGKGGASNCRLLGGRCERLRVDGEIREVFVRLCPAFTARMDDGALIVEQEIKRRGLIEKYQNALIELLNLDMQVFNSAIELNTHNVPTIPNNDFSWEGHAFLWQYSQAAAEQRCHAALRAVGIEV